MLCDTLRHSQTKDDNSSATSHAAAVQSLLEGGADAILCAQPVFATSESEQVRARVTSSCLLPVSLCRHLHSALVQWQLA